MKYFFLNLVFLFTMFSSLAQTQLGNDLDGSAAGDSFGFSTAICSNGNRIIIGALYSDDNGNNSGSALIYDWSGSDWIQVGQTIAGEAAFDSFGYAVSITSDGNRIAVGAEFNDGNGSNSGHVRVFDWDGNNWTQVGADIDGEAINDRSGRAVSLSANGNRVAIGADFNDGNGVNSGHVRVFEWNGNDWIQVGADIDGEASGDRSGGDALSLSADGNIIAIGAPENQGNGLDAGHVRVYYWNGSSWMQRGADIDGENAGDVFGDAVSLSADGNRFAAGSYLNDDNGTNAGYVSVFEWNGNNWVKVGANIYGESAGGISGEAISLSANGNRILIGTRGIGSGHARIFDWSGSDWIQVGTDIEGEHQGDGFGWSVSLSSDGNRAIVSAKSNDDNGTNAGHARIYDLSTITLGIDELTHPNKVSVYPNPISDSIYVDTSVFAKTISLLSLSGQIIKTVESKNSMNLSNFTSGIYILRIETLSGKTYYKKVIKQ